MEHDVCLAEVPITMMQSVDDEKEAGGRMDDAGSDERTKRVYAIWRRRLLVIAIACAVIALTMARVVSWLAPEYPPEPAYVSLMGYTWLTISLVALAAFAGALLCTLICCRGTALRRHVSVVLVDAVLMVLMYLYAPWIAPDDTIVYGWMGPPPWRPNEPLSLYEWPFAIGRFSDQYMLLVIASSVLILWLTRKPLADRGSPKICD